MNEDRMLLAKQKLVSALANVVRDQAEQHLLELGEAVDGMWRRSMPEHDPDGLVELRVTHLDEDTLVCTGVGWTLDGGPYPVILTTALGHELAVERLTFIVGNKKMPWRKGAYEHRFQWMLSADPQVQMRYEQQRQQRRRLVAQLQRGISKGRLPHLVVESLRQRGMDREVVMDALEKEGRWGAEELTKLEGAWPAKEREDTTQLDMCLWALFG